MPVTVKTDNIENLYPGGIQDQKFYIDVRGRRGTRTGSSTASMFRLTFPQTSSNYDNSVKVISGYSSGLDNAQGTGFRVTFPEAFTNQCVGLSITMWDTQSNANWDYFTNNDPGTWPSSVGPAIFQHAGVFDRTGFQCYCRYNFVSVVDSPLGNLIFSYTAWGQ
jgi:hypothetical protein